MIAANLRGFGRHAMITQRRYRTPRWRRGGGFRATVACVRRSAAVRSTGILGSGAVTRSLRQHQQLEMLITGKHFKAH